MLDKRRKIIFVVKLFGFGVILVGLAGKLVCEFHLLVLFIVEFTQQILVLVDSSALQMDRSHSADSGKPDFLSCSDNVWRVIVHLLFLEK